MLWVDDLLCVLPPLPEHEHDASTCGGHETCFMCACTRSRALKLEKEINREMDALGLFTNSKRQAPSREGEFIGLNYDTAACVFILLEEKGISLAATAQELHDQPTCSPRELSRF